MSKEYKDIIVGLDVGTSKVMVAVAEITSQNEIRLIGIGSSQTNDLKRGVVVNIDGAVLSIQKALREVEIMTDIKVNKVLAGISGNHIKGFNSSGMVAIKDKDVSLIDVEKVIETAKAVNISNDQKLLLVEPQEFLVDDEIVKEPVGMSGLRLEVRVHMVTGSLSASENMLKCIRRCGLEIENLSLNPLASSAAVLTEDEKDLGVVLIDIGAGTTDVAIFTAGAIRHTAVIPIAGDLITSDIAMALRIPTKEAEEIKVRYGVAKQSLVNASDVIDIPGLGEKASRPLALQALAAVIEPRVEEILSLVLQSIRNSGYEELLSSGVVLTGGACVMPGMVELAEEVFLRPVRIGVPLYGNVLSDMVAKPSAATMMGLLEEARNSRIRGQKVESNVSFIKQTLIKIKNLFNSKF